MSYCLNPNCMDPKNLQQATACLACGEPLLLRERYRANRILGQGGFGTTFLAVDEGLPGHPECVIKQLRPVLNTPEFVKQAQKLFQREATTLGKIGSHPQITRLLDFFELGQDFYLVQEYIHGYTLEQEARKSGPFEEAQVQEVLREVLPILDYLHSQKVIHRDIKPANIIRRSIDNKLILIDFGVVTDQFNRVSQASTDETLTKFSVGTQGFAAPEQVARRPVYASDLYSLGMTCVCLLLGRLPQELDYDPNTGGFSWQNEITISSRFQSILEKMLEVSIRDRYASAQDALAALEGLTQQPTPSVSQVVHPATTSNRAMAPAMAKSAPQPLGPGKTVAPTRQSDQMSHGSATFYPVNLANLKAASGPIKRRPWWNRPLFGKRGFTERLILIFRKPAVSDKAVSLHELALKKIQSLFSKAQTIDSEKFGNKEFLAFVRIQYALGKGDHEYERLTHCAELLRVGIKVKNSYIQIEQIELAYRGSKQQELYQFVQKLLENKVDQQTFRYEIQSHLEEILPRVKSEEGKTAIKSYIQELEVLAAHELGLDLLARFKQYELANYSILRIVSEIVNNLDRLELFDLKGLITEVISQHEVFEKLGDIIGVPDSNNSPETYARLLQYLALSEKYQSAYPKFQELAGLLAQWRRHYDTVVAIRGEFSPSEYKLPKTFRQDVPGVDLYDKYHGYFEKQAS